MKRRTTLLFSVLLLAVSHGVHAQALVYFDCEAESVRGLRGALADIYGAMSGGARPVVFLDDWYYTDGSLGTHRIIAAYPDYQSAMAFERRIGEVPAAQQAMQALESLARCDGPGLAVQRGVWGDQEAQVSFFAVYHIAASDGAAYTAAFERLAERQGDSPGPIFLFENRAGRSGVSHLVVVSAPSQVVLNEYLDTLYASDAFADFADDVQDVRTIVNVSQVERIMVLTPDGS